MIMLCKAWDNMSETERMDILNTVFSANGVPCLK